MNNKYNLNEESMLNLSTLISFTRVEHKIHELEYRTIKEGGLTIAQFGTLVAVNYDGDLSVGDIMDKILTTSGNITVVIKNLEKDGLVKRYQNEDDKRSTMVSITDKGKEIITKIFPNHIGNINNIFNILTDEEKITLNNILEKFKNL